MQLPRLLGPFGISLARDLPFPPFQVEDRVESIEELFERRLELLPDHVDLCVIRDGLQCDMRDSFTNEALADVAMRGGLRWN